MVLCPWHQFFQDTNHLNYLSLLSDVLEEAPMLDTPENLVVVRDGLTFSPIYLAHMKVSNDFLAWRLCNWKTPGIKMLLRLGVKNGKPCWIKKTKYCLLVYKKSITLIKSSETKVLFLFFLVLLYFGFISTREFISSPSRSYSSTWPLVHTFMRSVRSLLLGARMKS